MVKQFSLLILLFSQTIFAQQPKTQLSWPEITRENKPWTRWWWPGSIVDPDDLTAAMEKYSTAGLGGLELTVLYGVKGQEDKFINFLSPQWMKMFVYTLNEAKRLNIGVDLTNSSSWPFGGPWVTNDDASKYVAYKTWSLKEGENLKESIIYIQEPSIRFNGTASPDISTLIDPVYKNKGLQTLAIDLIRFQKPMPLQVLMAYSGAGQVLDLTDKVDVSGNLNWTAPAGTWTLYGVFQGWHGKMVERAGPGGEGYVIDHFSGKAISDYLKYFDDAFKGSDISYLRGYFNDSYEVDGARGRQSCWTPDLFNEFKARRSYDLRQNLPALFQKDTPEKNARVLCDYRQTVSDLILDKFTTGWTDWANKQGKITRNQAHGSPGNILDLYAATDIPETEGYEILSMKFGTSAANVSGKKFASAEAATWLGEHFSSTLNDVKKAVDQYFIAGVNHLFYHGTCYSPQNDPWPGFQFYASVEFSPANSFWNDFLILNNYAARVQSFTQLAKPDNDILFYFPIFDWFSDYNNAMLENFGAINRFNGTLFKVGAQTMVEKGYAFDYISDMQIKNTTTYDNLLQTSGGASYKTIVLPGCKYIPVGTFNKIINLAEEGAIVIVLGNLPEDVSGWADLESNREIFRHLKEKLKFSETTDKDVRQAIAGTGKVLFGNDLEKLFSFAGIRRESLVDDGLKYTRRRDKNGSYYFILNQTNKPFVGWIPLQVKARSAGLFNPMTGKSGMAKSRVSPSGNIEIYARLSPSESIITRTFDSKQSGNKFLFYDTISAAQEVKGIWKVDFIEGGPELPSSKEINKLVSWTVFGGDAVKNFSGTAKYSISFSKPAGKADAWQLNLGKVCESARIFLNGSEIARLIGPDYQTVIQNSQLKSKNILEIKVSNLAENRVAYLDRNNVQWKKFYNINFPSGLPQNRKNGLFDASTWLPRESGLIGPVTMTAMKKVK